MFGKQQPKELITADNTTAEVMITPDCVRCVAFKGSLCAVAQLGAQLSAQEDHPKTGICEGKQASEVNRSLRDRIRSWLVSDCRMRILSEDDPRVDNLEKFAGDNGAEWVDVRHMLKD